jgi:hypothetical protein
MSEKAPLPIPVGRYIDPLSDFGFKLLFGSDPNKEILIAFLNELFKGRKFSTVAGKCSWDCAIVFDQS